MPVWFFNNLQFSIRHVGSLDFAAVKLFVGGPKDIALLAHLHAAGLINAEVVRTRVNSLDIPVEHGPRLHSNFLDVFGA